MAQIDTSVLTIPSSSGGSDAENQRKLAYVLLQVWQEAKDNDFILDDGKLTDAETTAFQALWDAQELMLLFQSNMLTTFYNIYPSDIYSELLILCSGMQTEITALLALPMTKENYRLRRQSLETQAEILSVEFSHIQVQMIQELQYNGVEIDLDTIKFILFGRNLLVSP